MIIAGFLHLKSKRPSSQCNSRWSFIGLISPLDWQMDSRLSKCCKQRRLLFSNDLSFWFCIESSSLSKITFTLEPNSQKMIYDDIVFHWIVIIVKIESNVTFTLEPNSHKMFYDFASDHPHCQIILLKCHLYAGSQFTQDVGHRAEEKVFDCHHYSPAFGSEKKYGNRLPLKFKMSLFDAMRNKDDSEKVNYNLFLKIQFHIFLLKNLHLKIWRQNCATPLGWD